MKVKNDLTVAGLTGENLTINGLTGQIITTESVKTSLEELDAAISNQEANSNQLVNLGVFGLTDRSQVNIYLSGTDTDIVNIDKQGASYTYYFDGELVTVSTNKSIQLLGTPHTNGLHFIYFSDNQGTLSISNTAWNLLSTVPLAVVFWCQSNAIGFRALLADEAHTCLMPKMVHKNLHLAHGTKLISGGVLSGYTLLSDTNTNVTFGVSASTIADEDIFLNLSSLVDGNGSGANYTIFYHTDATTWKFTSSNNFPYNYTVNGRLNYDGLASGLVQCANSRFVNYYLWLTNFQGEARYILITGQAQYTAKTDAINESVGDLDLNGFPTMEAVAIAQITFSTKDGRNNTGKCWIENVKLINVSLSTIINPNLGMLGANILLTTTTFDGVLDSAVTDVQQLAEKVDNLAGAGLEVVNSQIKVINSNLVKDSDGIISVLLE